MYSVSVIKNQHAKKRNPIDVCALTTRDNIPLDVKAIQSKKPSLRFHMTTALISSHVLVLVTMWLIGVQCFPVQSYLVSAGSHHRRVPTPRPTRGGVSFSSRRANTSNDIRSEDTLSNSKNRIPVSAEIEIPLAAEIAFDAFADLPRQATWADWLKSVEYISPDNPETMWKMSYLGLSYSWKAISTRQERPFVIEWESTSGLKNFGRVDFTKLDSDRTHMKLTLTFLAPRLLVKMLGQQGAIARLVEKRMLQTMLHNFRDIVVVESTSNQQPQLKPLSIFPKQNAESD
jgi:uncharacterized membrane protein